MAFIALNNVSFTYPDAVEPAIQNFSLQIEKGQFVVLFGPSGSGKSTLLRLLKKEIQPHGELTGEILINGQQLEETAEIGFVFQDPENQVVAGDVLHELVFGLENSGLQTNEMRSRVAEMVHFFGAESLLQQKMQELSGGKKQQINLASVLLLQPDILLLDEPTSQLDPVSARELLDMLVRLNEEFGMTIILAEHRLEEIIGLADKAVLMEKGKLIQAGEPRTVLSYLWNTPFREYIPSIPTLFFELAGKGTVPLTVKEGRIWSSSFSFKQTMDEAVSVERDVIAEASHVFFRYDQRRQFILDDLDIKLEKGDFYALMGGNGSGKSTLLKILSGIIKPQHGKVVIKNQLFKSKKANDLIGKIGYLPQDPKLFFLYDSVEKEIEDTIKRWNAASREEADLLLAKLGISQIAKNHPHDLSGGELQKAALACLLLRKPDILMLDEPTKGLDPISKKNLAVILQELNQAGMTILMSTHDIEFAAKYALKCGMMFQGKISSEDSPNHFFNGNFFYSTMIQRLFRKIEDQQILIVEEAVSRCIPTN